MPSSAAPNPLRLLIDAQQSRYEKALIRVRRVDRSILESDELLLAREGPLSVFYAPFDSVAQDARVVLLGLTPGWQQMSLAIEAYRTARWGGHTDAGAQREAKASASFAGMRSRIARWLDDLDVNEAVGRDSAAELFNEASILHTTSLIRYPVFVGAAMANYRGASPRPEASPLLRSLISELLIPELNVLVLANALIVPMGTAVGRALVALKVPVLDRCLIGFPHPSGANGWANRQFAENRATLLDAVAAWKGSTPASARL